MTVRFRQKAAAYTLAALGAFSLAACDAPSAKTSASRDSADKAQTEIEIPSIEVHIPYEQFTLDNGLRVVVHEDRKAPVVAVSVWYHVGSKDEPEGKSGFAHLFEHLMFNGSENYDDEYFRPIEQVGATGVNGTTWFDRTNYFETVPTPALDLALWLESDRMGHLLGAVTQEKLDEQRAVVQNEKRQGDNQPYGMVEYRQLEALYPPGHPYRHSTIGSMADLNAASMEDVQAWFKQYYGAANTVLVLAGDINAEEAKPLVEKYFGDIAAGPALNHHKSWVPTRDTDLVDEMIDTRAANTRLYYSWSTPPRTHKDAHVLRVAADILGDGKNSRLYKALSYDQQLASSINVYNQRFELASVFNIEIDVQNGVDPAKVKMITDKVLADFMAEGPTAEEVARAKTKIIAGRVRGLEQVGGFGGKAVALAQGLLYAGDAAFYAKELDWISNASASDIQATYNNWMSKGGYKLTVKPYGEYQTLEAGADRSKLPDVGAMPGFDFPEVQEATLSNGMKVVLATRTTIPVVEARLNFDAGYASDPQGRPGIAGFTLGMLDEGTTSKDALQIASELEMLGANLSTGSGLDSSSVSLSALKSNLKPSLQIMGDVVRNPSFADAELERARARGLARIQQEGAQPLAIGLRTLPGLVYGEGHAYSAPYTGSGTTEVISSLTREDLVAFKDNWLRPDNATLYMVGDVTMDEALPLLEEVLGDWKAPAMEKPTKNIGAVELPIEARTIIIDTPDAPQTFILAAHLLPGNGAEDYLATQTANEALGGSFTARVNMNLREDKGWSYGAQTIALGAKGQRMWLIYAPVQTDKTGLSVAELQREVSEYLGTNPATAEELAKVIANNTNSLPGQFETASAVLASIVNNDVNGRPYDYAEGTRARYDALNLEAVHKAARDHIKPNSLTWLLVGDMAKIRPQLEEIGLTNIVAFDPAAK